MGSMSVSSCRCCMFVSGVHPVAVLNDTFCMTCSLLMLLEDAPRHIQTFEYKAEKNNNHIIKISGPSTPRICKSNMEQVTSLANVQHMETNMLPV